MLGVGIELTSGIVTVCLNFQLDEPLSHLGMLVGIVSTTLVRMERHAHCGQHRSLGRDVGLCKETRVS